MLADQELGRRHDCRLRAGFDDRHGGKQRHHRLAGPDVALEKTEHPFRPRQIRIDLRDRRSLAGGEREGQRGEDLPLDAAVALAGATGASPLMRPEEREGKLARQHLVISEARQSAAFRLEIGGRERMVGERQGGNEVRPVLLRLERRVEPFGEGRETGEPRFDDAGERLPREPRGQWIDRLDQRQAGEVGFLDDVIRVDHARTSAEPLHLAADIERPADRKGLLHPGAVGVKEGEGDLAGVVMGEDAIGDAAVVRRRLLVPVDANLERDDGALGSERNARLIAPVDDADRQVEEEVENPCRFTLGAADETREQPAVLRADAAEIGHRAEERVQNIGPHRQSLRQLAYGQMLRLSCTRAAASRNEKRPAGGEGPRVPPVFVSRLMKSVRAHFPLAEEPFSCHSVPGSRGSPPPEKPIR